MRIWFISAVVRYIPGNIWQPLSMTIQCRRWGVPVEATLTSIALYQAIILLAVAPLTALYLALTGNLGLLTGYLARATPWLIGLAALPALLFLVRPQWLIGAINWGLSKVGRTPLAVRLTGARLLWLLVVAALNWLLWGAAFAGLAFALSQDSPAQMLALAPHLIFSYPIAYAIGFLSFITPSGFGVPRGRVLRAPCPHRGRRRGDRVCAGHAALDDAGRAGHGGAGSACRAGCARDRERGGRNAAGSRVASYVRSRGTTATRRSPWPLSWPRSACASSGWMPRAYGTMKASPRWSGAWTPAPVVHWTAADIQPPLYYLIVHVWGWLAGWSEWSLRFVSVWFGLLVVPLFIVLTRRFRPMAAVTITAALLAALHPLLVYYSQEARMYAPLTALALLLGYALLRYGGDGRARPWLITYALAGHRGGLHPLLRFFPFARVGDCLAIRTGGTLPTQGGGALRPDVPSWSPTAPSWWPICPGSGSCSPGWRWTIATGKGVSSWRKRCAKWRSPLPPVRP